MNYLKNIKEIKKFAEKINIDVKYLLGEKYEGNLWLDYIESLPANIVFNVGRNLNLYSVCSLPDNIVFNVGRNLVLNSVESLPSNVIFNVAGEVCFPLTHKVKVIW